MKYLLFDLDRTLWDFDGNANRTYRVLFDEFALGDLSHVDYETFHAKYCEINDMLWEAYRNGTVSKEELSLRRFSYTLAAFGCDADSPEIISLSLKMSDYYIVRCVAQTGLMPGARDILEWLATQRDKFSVSVITNGFSEAQLPKMKTSGIDRYVDHVFLSENLGFMKPDRRFFDVVLAKLNVNPEECIVIGDDYRVDIEGAAKVGIPQIYYNYKKLPIPEGHPNPTYEIYDLRELINTLNLLNPNPRA